MATVYLNTYKSLEGKIEYDIIDDGSDGYTVEAQLYVKKTSNTTQPTSGRSWSGFLKIGSTTVNIALSSSTSVGTSWVQMCTNSTYISYNGYGEQTTTISGKCVPPTGTQLYSNGSYTEGSSTITLGLREAPVAAGAAGIDYATNINSGASCSIAFTPTSTEYHYLLRITNSGRIVHEHVFTTSSLSQIVYSGYSPTVTDCPPSSGSNISQCTVYLYTLDNSESQQIGDSSSAIFNITYNITNYIPTISSVRLSQNNVQISNSVVEVGQNLVITISATIPSGQIESYKLSGSYSGVYTSNVITLPITKSGNTTITVAAISASGYTSEPVTTLVTAIALTPPSITVTDVTRSGASCSITFSATSSPLTNLTQYAVQYKTNNGSYTTATWSSYTSGVKTHTINNLNVNNAYTFKISVKDAKNQISEVETETVGAFKLVNIGETSIGIGEMADGINSFNCALNANFKGGLTVQGHSIPELVFSALGYKIVCGNVYIGFHGSSLTLTDLTIPGLRTLEFLSVQSQFDNVNIIPAMNQSGSGAGTLNYTTNSSGVTIELSTPAVGSSNTYQYRYCRYIAVGTPNS